MQDAHALYTLSGHQGRYGHKSIRGALKRVNYYYTRNKKDTKRCKHKRARNSNNKHKIGDNIFHPLNHLTSCSAGVNNSQPACSPRFNFIHDNKILKPSSLVTYLIFLKLLYIQSSFSFVIGRNASANSRYLETVVFENSLLTLSAG